MSVSGERGWAAVSVRQWVGVTELVMQYDHSSLRAAHLLSLQCS